MTGEKKREFEHAVITDDELGTQIAFKIKPALVKFVPEKAPNVSCNFFPPQGTKIFFNLKGSFGQISNPSAEVMARKPPEGFLGLFEWEGKGVAAGRPQQSTKHFTTWMVNAVAADAKVFNEAAKRVGITCLQDSSEVPAPFLSLNDMRNIAGHSLGARVTK